MNDLLEKIIDGNGWLPICEAKPHQTIFVRTEDGVLGIFMLGDSGINCRPTDKYLPLDAVDMLVSEIKRLRERDTIMREALEKLARLGTGSSHSNMIAKQAIEWADELNGGE